MDVETVPGLDGFAKDQADTRNGRYSLADWSSIKYLKKDISAVRNDVHREVDLLKLSVSEQ